MSAPDRRPDAEIIAGWEHGVSGSVVRDGRVVHVEHIWSTVITIDIPGAQGREQDAIAALAQCTAFFRHVDATFSTFKPLSEATLYRNGLTRPGQLSADFEEVMVGCQRAADLTGRTFDPWSVPGGYDPSGFVKGWAAGRAGRLLAEAGFADHMVNAGGDMWCSGDEHPRSRPAPVAEEVAGQEPPDGWRVGIVNPHARTEIVGVVALHDQAMATSGTYERGLHVLDPRTRRPASGVDSATVIGPDPGLADALASAALVAGTSSVNWFGALGPAWSLHMIIGQAVHTTGPAFPAAAG